LTVEKDLPDFRKLVATRFEQSMSVPEAFFATETGRIAEACWAMACRFYQGGRLLAFGNGAWATDAQHVSVEFVHPVLVGRRALPALALTNDSATLSGMMAGGDVAMSCGRASSMCWLGHRTWRWVSRRIDGAQMSSRL